MKRINILLIMAGVLLLSSCSIRIFRRPDPCVKLQSEGYKKMKRKKPFEFHYKYLKPKYRYKRQR